MLIYVVFPAGKGPSQVDRQKLEGCRGLFQHLHTGVDTGAGGFAIEFLSGEFQRAYDRNQDFQQLVNAWKESGCVVTNLVEFKRAVGSVQPPQNLPEKKQRGRGQNATGSQKPPPTNAKEAEALMKMETAGRLGETDHGKLRFVAKYIPHALIAGGGILTALAGYKIATRLKDNPREERRRTIERMAKDGMNASPQAEIDPEKAQAAEEKEGRPASFQDTLNTPKDNERGR